MKHQGRGESARIWDRGTIIIIYCLKKQLFSLKIVFFFFLKQSGVSTKTKRLTKKQKVPLNSQIERDLEETCGLPGDLLCRRLKNNDRGVAISSSISPDKPQCRENERGNSVAGNNAAAIGL